MLHKTMLIGNLGKDPEMQYFPDATPFTTFSVAAAGKAKKVGDKWVPQTTWFSVIIKGAQAEACHQFLSKGSKVYVEGELKSDDKGAPRTFTRRDGTVGASFEIDASFVKFLDSKSQGESNGSSRDDSGHAPAADEKEEIPF